MFATAFLCLAVGPASASPATPRAEAALERLAALPLKDQHGRPLRLRDLRGAPAVVLLVSARQARLLRGWEQALGEPRPAVFRVIDVPPGGDAGRVAEMLRRRAPAGVRLAIDGGRAFAQALQVDPAQPAIFVLDGDGALRALVRGRARAESAEAVRAAIRAAGQAR
jgi:hypothetical protein